MEGVRMNRAVLLRLLSWVVAATTIAQRAAAQPPDILRDYRFIPSHSTVHVSGGFAGFNMDLSVAGTFGMVTGYDYEVSPTTHVPTLVPHAEFVGVDAILFNPLSLAPLPVPGWDLDRTLNLTGLHGTFQDPRVLKFIGEDGQGWPISLQAVIRGPLLHLTGSNRPGCCDFFSYTVDALAYLKPYSDFNLDGKIDSTDLQTWLSNVGRLTDASLEQGDADGDGDVDGDDFLAWQRTIGAATILYEFTNSGTSSGLVPEPGAAALLMFGAVILGLRRRR
jgi:hypothetical protein